MVKRARKSWIWKYFTKSDEEQEAYCMICDQDKKFPFVVTGSSTSSLHKHLRGIHQEQYEQNQEVKSKKRSADQEDQRDEVSSSESVVANEQAVAPGTSASSFSRDSPVEPAADPPAKKPRRRSRTSSTVGPCTCTQHATTEQISQALAKLVCVALLPISFASSCAFKDFMKVVQPNYICPSSESIKKRLHLMSDGVKSKITAELSEAKGISWTTDCWTSRSQESYITVTCNLIDDHWIPKCFTLTTEEMEERHTAVQLASKLRNVMTEWAVPKVAAIVSDNAKNIVNAITLLTDVVEEPSKLTCAAHSLQLVVNKALERQKTAGLIQTFSKIVGHFRHSTVASSELEKMQILLKMKPLKLIQCVKTRWNSAYLMLERLTINRVPIANVLSNRDVTSAAIAQKLAITEEDWVCAERLVRVLKPFEVATEVLCGDTSSPVSMVRPIIWSLIDKHLNLSSSLEEDDETVELKADLVSDLEKRFDFGRDEQPDNDNDHHKVSARQIASLLDPRYKTLAAERTMRAEIQDAVLNKLLSSNDKDNNDLPLREQQTVSHSEATATGSSALDFLFQSEPEEHDTRMEFALYLAEPQIGHNQDPYKWWKTHEADYPTVAALAKTYLSIPSTSASSERNFSTAGNIITPKRACLLPENVKVLTFLYDNRNLL